MPQHFQTNTGSGECGHRWSNWTDVCKTMGCQSVPAPVWAHPSDGAIESVRINTTAVAGHKTPVLDYTSFPCDAHLFHSRSGGCGCSHCCHTPMLWDPMLLLTAEAIRHAC